MICFCLFKFWSSSVCLVSNSHAIATNSNTVTNCTELFLRVFFIWNMWSFFSRDSSKDFPYEIGECVGNLDAKSIWSLHRAKKKNSNEEVSVFVYDIKSGSDIKLEIARSSMKRLKTLRHPSILQYLDSIETEKMLYVATEYVQPLGIYLETLDKESPQNDLYLAWGIFQITVRTKKSLFIFNLDT